LQAAQGAFQDGFAEVFLGSQSGEDSYKAYPTRILVKTQSGEFGSAIQIDTPINELEGTAEVLSFISYESDSLELSDSETLWVGNGVYSVDSVKLDTTYTYPTNSSVSVTFTALPEESGSLQMSEVTLTDEQVSELGA